MKATPSLDGSNLNTRPVLKVQDCATLGAKISSSQETVVTNQAALIRVQSDQKTGQLRRSLDQGLMYHFLQGIKNRIGGFSPFLNVPDAGADGHQRLPCILWGLRNIILRTHHHQHSESSGTYADI